MPQPTPPQLLGSLVGNDFVQSPFLDAWQSPLLPGRHKSGAPLIHAVASKVLSAAAAAGWTGPSPATPLLWAALDDGGLLDARARGLISASLDQYRVDDPDASAGGEMVPSGWR